MTRRRTAILFAALLAAGTATAAAAPGDVTRVSVTDAGAEANALSEGTAVSADGRFVAFVSAAQLTAAPTGGKKQLYVRDRATGRTVLASAGVDPGDSFNSKIDISSDGRYAVFGSTATNLVAGDTDANADVFRTDLRTGAVVLVSVNSRGEKANAGVGGDPSISGDGERVAFTTGTATNLFPGDVGNAADVVVRDIAAGTTTLVSQNSQGQQSNGTTERPAISADGRVVAFEAVLDATNLFPGDDNATNDIVVRDLAAGTTTAASVAADGKVLGGNIPDISGDGRYVVFQTGASLDPINDANGGDVYRRDMRLGVSTLVSARTGADGRGNGDSRIASISADGTRIAFESTATDLTADDDNAATADVYVRDQAGRTTTRASVRADGAQAANASTLGVVAPNGGPAAFTYDDTGGKPFLTGDANAVADIFLKELAPSDTTGPALTVTGPASASDAGATLTGTVSDASGVIDLRVGDAAIRPAADGTFRAPVTLGAPGSATTVTVTATDGAGATTTVTHRITRAAAPDTAQPGGTVARATALRVTRRGERIIVRFRLSGNARVAVRVLRRVAPAGTRARLVPVGGAPARTLAAGVRTIAFPAPGLRPGTHRVQLTVRAGGRVSTATVALRVGR